MVLDAKAAKQFLVIDHSEANYVCACLGWNLFTASDSVLQALVVTC